EPYTPTFDTGAHRKPEPDEPEPPARPRRWWRRRSDPPATELKDEPASGAVPVPDSGSGEMSASEPIHPPAPSITVPGRYHYVKWWQFILMIIAVWIPAAAIGPGLFYWWTQDHSRHKTAVVFVVLIYVVVCTVAGLMLAMVPDRPLVSALAIAVMSALFASVAAAAPFYGAFYCDHTTGPCLMGIIPY
ncbi:MAG: hypothetical protein ACRDU0_05935, partial [Mycobacterium sp.]